MICHRRYWIFVLWAGLLATVGAGQAQAKWEFAGPDALANVARALVDTLSAKSIEPHQCPYHLVLDDITVLGEEASKQFHDAMTIAIREGHPEGEGCMVIQHSIGDPDSSTTTREELLMHLSGTGTGTVIEMSYFTLDAQLVVMARATSTEGSYRGYTDQIPLPARQVADHQSPTPAKKAEIAAAPVETAGRTLSIHGSSALAERLMPSLARAFLMSQTTSKAMVVSESSDDNGDHVLTLKDVTPDQIGKIRIRSNGAFQALDNLNADRTDLVASYRPVTDAEHDSFTQKYGVDMRTRDAEHVIGLAGVEVLVNQTNKLPMVSRETLRQIYSKKILSWQDPAVVEADLQGGIKAIGPGAGSNATGILRTLIMQDQPPLYQSSLDWGNEIPSMVAADRNTIAFATAHLPGSGSSVAIDECGHAYDFDPFSIKSLDHPLSIPLFLYVNPSKANHDRDRFLNFVMSSSPGQGQSIVNDHFTNLEVLIADDTDSLERQKVVDQQEPVLRNSKLLFRMIIGEARRASTTFRFRFDSEVVEINSYGQRAIERLIETIRNDGITADRVILFGFADSQGAANYNLELAAGRAKSVAQALHIYGLEVPERNIFAIGEDAPISCNLTGENNVDEIGAARNRRVEVWIVDPDI